MSTYERDRLGQRGSGDGDASTSKTSGLDRLKNAGLNKVSYKNL